MKHILAGALLLSSISFPAFASSIELIDNMVTGPKGSSSIITLGPVEPCTDSACTDATGGDPKMVTMSAQRKIELLTAVAKKINFDFARKFPDPAIPVPTAPTESASGTPAAVTVPKAPADSGTIAAQPPVGSQPGSPPTGRPPEGAPVQGQQANGAPVDGAPADGTPVDAASADGTRGSIDPSARIIPVANN